MQDHTARTDEYHIGGREGLRLRRRWCEWDRHGSEEDCQ
jgi:hypothetical protein